MEQQNKNMKNKKSSIGWDFMGNLVWVLLGAAVILLVITIISGGFNVESIRNTLHI